MARYDAYSDDFYVNINLNTEMEMASNREAVLHYFEQVRKRFPSMRNFYGRERGEYVMEEDKESGAYRWTSLEPRRLCSGYVNPPSVDLAVEQHTAVLEVAPYALSISPLDCESFNFMMGFDYTYRGNHNQLLAEALGVAPAFERMIELPGATLLAYEPTIQFALDPECRVQCRISVEARTSAFHVRTGDFPEDQLSVYLTLRRFGGLEPGETYIGTMHMLKERCLQILDQHVIEQVLLPLQQAISIN